MSGGWAVGGRRAVGGGRWVVVGKWRQGVPRLMEAHAGGGCVAPQSTHALLPSTWRTRPKTVPSIELKLMRAAREQPSNDAVAFCMTVHHCCISS